MWTRCKAEVRPRLATRPCCHVVNSRINIQSRDISGHVWHQWTSLCSNCAAQDEANKYRDLLGMDYTRTKGMVEFYSSHSKIYRVFKRCLYSRQRGLQRAVLIYLRKNPFFARDWNCCDVGTKTPIHSPCTSDYVLQKWRCPISTIVWVKIFERYTRHRVFGNYFKRPTIEISRI